jgi:RNA polymerase sigma factor (sigma-70 family)
MQRPEMGCSLYLFDFTACLLERNSLHNEKRLLHSLSEGNEHAFTQLYNVHRNKIYNDALRLIKSPVLAEEIIQDVFLRVWLKRTEMADINNLESFLHTVSRNLIFDHLKKISYQVVLKENIEHNSKPVTDTDFLVRQHQCQLMLAEAVSKLCPKQKQVYQLAKIDGLSHEIIAQKLDLSRLTVKKHMANSLHIVRQYLNKYLFLLFPIFFCQ